MATTTKKINITGVQAGLGPNNQTPVRLEINTYLEDADRRNLLLLGLERIQARPQSDMKSWYQIAGIHGRPYTPWNGEGNRAGQKPGGYCTHSSALFLSWHRPYLALIEMVLYGDIQEIVKTFPAGAKRDRLAQVALTFRLPYWDWASKPVPHPLLIQRTVSVEKPTGVVTIPNPLYSYRFQSTSDFPVGQYRNWKQTLRHPISASAAQSQDDVFARISQDLERKDTEDRFAGRRGTWVNIRERIWLLLNVEQNRYPTYTAFSNDRWVNNGRSSDYDSIESVHNSLHGMIGGGGHMGDPGYAGFDPVFWLHHSNVDRIWALWQALHPESDLNWSFGEAAETQHTFHWWNTSPDNREEETTPLIPFHKTDTTYWDSNSVRDFKVFGYTYPELTEWNIPGVSRTQLRGKVAVAVRNLYANQTTAGSLLNAVPAPAPAPAASVSVRTAPASVPTASPFLSLASIPKDMPPLEEKPAQATSTTAQKAPQNPLQAAAAASGILKTAPAASKPQAPPQVVAAVTPKATPQTPLQVAAAAPKVPQTAPKTATTAAPKAPQTVAAGSLQAVQDTLQEAIAKAAKAASEAVKHIVDPTKGATKGVSSIEKILNVPLSSVVKNSTHREYFANIRTPKYSFNGPYVVHVFMGPFTEDYKERPFDKNLVGSVFIFANNIATTGCANCIKNAAENLTVTGAVPLTSALLERIEEVGSLDPADVEPYLKQHLHWRIHYSDTAHENIDRRDAEQLKFTVTSVVVEHPAAPDMLPVYRDWNPIPGITAGRPTGAGFNDAEGYEG